jgi:hypothetical protein
MTRAELIGEATDNPAVQVAMLRRAIVRTRGVVAFAAADNGEVDLRKVDAAIDDLEIDQNQIHTICLGLLHVTLKKNEPDPPPKNRPIGEPARGSETTLENSTRTHEESAAP